MQHVLMRLRLKDGALPRFNEYLAEFEARRAECEASLEGEGAVAEAFFLVGNDVFIYKLVHDPARVRQFQKTSALKIYELVEAMMADCIEAEDKFPTVLGFSR